MYMIQPMGIERGVIRLSDKAWIPASLENRDWKDYLLWAQNNTPLDWADNYGE